MPRVKRRPVGPLYAKVKYHLLENILNGTLEPGRRIPSENELVKSFSVSRMTANRALRELMDEGYVTRIAGVGTFVADFKAKGPLVEVRNIADEVRERRHDYSSLVILHAPEKAPPAIAQNLDMPQSALVFHTIIVHNEQGVPIQLEERYVNPDVVPAYGGADFSQTTPSAFLLQAAPLQEAEHTVKAIMPSDRIRQLLHMEPQEPCLVVERRTWSNSRPATLATLYHPGNRFELSGHFQP